MAEAVFSKCIANKAGSGQHVGPTPKMTGSTPIARLLLGWRRLRPCTGVAGVAPARWRRVRAALAGHHSPAAAEDAAPVAGQRARHPVTNTSPMRGNGPPSIHRSSADGGAAVGADVRVEMKDVVRVIALLDLLQSTEIGAISRLESPGFVGGHEVRIGP